MTTLDKALVFLGPTLAPSLAREICTAEIRGPAAMGDITRAVSDGATTIVLIDGVFESGPSVWHKEILWALSRGVGVVGAASMGALRAAELYQFGMLGHGEVFKSFTNGELHDDDEVAVLHGPAETGYMPLSDAMVDIRDAVRSALAEDVFTPNEAATIISFAKTEYFKTRNIKCAIQTGLKDTRSVEEIKEILAWFTRRPMSAKARDATSLLVNLESIAVRAADAARAAPLFTPTVYLKRLEPFGFPAQPPDLANGGA
jgi:hypothetical protein